MDSRFLPSTLLPIAFTACSLIVNSDRHQCDKDGDCATQGFGNDVACTAGVCVATNIDDAGAGDAASTVIDDPIWGCLGKVPALPPEEPDVPVHFFFSFFRALSRAPLVDMPVKACLQNDLTCAAQFGATTRTDANGLLDIPLYSGFRGYLDIGAPPTVSDLLPAILYVRPVPDKNVVAAPSADALASILTRSEFAALVGSVQKPIKDEAGHLIFATLDCQSHLAENALVRTDSRAVDTFSYYSDTAGTPSLTQEKTSTSGNGGFLNLPAGMVRLTMTLDDGRFVGAHDVVVRAGTVTYLLFSPTP